MFPALWLTLVGGQAEAADRGARADDAMLSDEYVVPPKNRLWYTSAVFARVNPLGLIEVARVGWRHRLSDKDSLLWKDTYTHVAASTVITPAWGRLGVYAEIQPIALLRLFADVSATSFFGTFDQVLSWSDPAARYSDQTIADLGALGQAEPRSGWVATFGGTLQAKAGPIAIRSTAQVTNFNIALPGNDAYFYDQYWDRLAPNGSWMVLNDLDVLYVKDKVRIGTRYTFSDGLDGQRDANDGALSHHRLGPMFAYAIRNKVPGTRFNQPTVFAVTQWWLRHPYRTGGEQPVAFPLIAVGFAFNGDLVGDPVPRTAP